MNHFSSHVISEKEVCDGKRQERGVLAARGAESADSEILNRNRGDNRLESDLQPTTSLATFRGLAGTFWPIIVARPWKVEWNQRKDSPVAQLVEQATVNRLVIGSSPIGGAKFCQRTSADSQVNRKRRECPSRRFLLAPSFSRSFW